MNGTFERIANLPPKKLALLACELQSRVESLERARREPVAIIGIGCRFPGADGPAAFWKLLRDGVDAVTEVPPERWDIDAYYDQDPDAPGKMSTRFGAFLEGVDQFDAQFFGIAPREAQCMDPQQRLLLEVCWEALENAGLSPEKLHGTPTGVFVGVSGNDYQWHILSGQDAADFDVYLATGVSHSVAAGRISYLLGLHGPSFAVDTACSSSLVAVHEACLSLRAGECRLALAGGVNVILSPEVTIALSRAHMMAPDGRCKAFDARGDGFVRGEGCGIVVLKRLADALADGDAVLAVIRGTAINQDGRSSGLTAPNGRAQEDVVRKALEDGAVDPDLVSYVEAHGTGTSLGDPIEALALGAVLGKNRPKDRPLLIGSVKTNFGHLESAAGVAGLIKVALALQHEVIPPHLHFKDPNPYIPWADLPIRVPTERTAWPRGDGRRIAGVSSFGFSGTNVHMVLEEAPATPPLRSGVDRPIHLLTLSAKSDEALWALADKYERHLAADSSKSVADVCSTANRGRAQFPHRLAVMAASTTELHRKLAAASAGEEVSGVFRGQARGTMAPEVAFLFTGLGAHYAGMGRELYETQPTFRRALERCAELLRGRLERPLLDVMFGDAGAQVDEVRYGQPALFALQWALAELWRSWGIEPTVVMGHSAGEFAAAAVAGVLSLGDGLTLTAERGRLLQELPREGAMMSLLASEERARAAIAPYGPDLAIAAVNGPESVVISGRRAVLEEVGRELEAAGVKIKPLAVPVASHSPLMEPILDAFEHVAATLRYQPPRLALVSNLTGQLVQAGEIDATYWRRHLREPVQFRAGMATLRAQGCQVFVELGPHPVLLGMGPLCFPEGSGTWLPTLHRDRGAWEQVLETLGTLYVLGASVDWVGFDRDYPRRKVSLPTYPFQRERSWIEAGKPGRRTAASPAGDAALGKYHPILGRRLGSPISKHVAFERRLSAHSCGFLSDHQIDGLVVVPAPAYLEMALAAAAEALGPGPHLIADLAIHEVLTLSEDERTVQLILEPDDAGAASFQIFSAPSLGATEGDAWRLHASGRVRRQDADASSPVRPGELAGVQARCPEEISGDAYYERLQEYGVQFGARFRGIERLWRREGEALGRIHLLEAVAAEAAPYQMHPAFLDACIQVIGAAMPTTAGPAAHGDPYVLIGLERFRSDGYSGSRVWSHAAFRDGVGGPHAECLTADVRVVDETGRVVADVEGAVLKRVGREGLRRARHQRLGEWLYEVQWQATPRRGQQGTATSASFIPSLLEIAERVDREVPRLSAQHGMLRYKDLIRDLEHVSAGYVLRALRGLGWEPRIGDRVSLEALVTRLGVASPHYRLLGRMLQILEEDGILRGAGSDWEVAALPASDDPEERRRALETGYPTAEAELTLLGRCGERLVEVLRGECDPLQLLFPGGSLSHLEKLYQEAPFALVYNAMVRETIATALEGVPPGRTVRILEIGAGTGGTTSAVLSALPPDRTEYVFSDISPVFTSKAQQKFSAYPFVRYELLDVEQDPGLQGFAERQFDVVLAANVLHATRDLRQSLRHIRALLAPEGLLVLLEGTQPVRWVDLTFGLTEGWWKFDDPDLRPSHPLLDQRTWVTTLRDLGFTDALTIPDGREGDTGLAQEALILARGPRVGPGKVMAAPRKPPGSWLVLADRAGVGDRLADLLRQSGDACTVVTAGATCEGPRDPQLEIDPANPQDFQRLLRGASEPGRPPLRGVVHLWTLDAPPTDETSVAALEAASALGCRSVLYMLQALVNTGLAELPKLWLVTRGAQPAAGSAASLAVAQAPVWGIGRVAAMEHPEVWGGLVDLDPAGAEDDAERLLAELTDPDGEDQLAFRAHERYAARLVRGTLAGDPAPPPLRGDGTYLITGGMGGMGIRVARWMVEHGARHLVLLGRSAPSVEAARTISELERAGARVVIARGDVSREEDVKGVFAEIRRAMPPLRGIIQAAGVFDDRVLLRHDWERFVKVLAPKVSGSWNLHTLTQGMVLDFFVLFSSAASFLGPIGLGNYTAANAFLDALAHYRRTVGLPALSINWGPWAKVGMAEAVGSRRESQWAAGGFGTMTSEDALILLGQLLGGDVVQIGVLPGTWPTLIRHFAPGREPPLLSQIAREVRSQRPTTQRSKPPAGLLERLQAAPPGDRPEILVAHLREQVAKVLGLDPSRVADSRRGLFEMGMDSLTALELKNRLQASVGRSLPATLIFDHPSMEALARYLGTEVLSLGAAETSPEGIPGDEQDVEREARVAERGHLSEEELTDLLAKTLQQARGSV